MKLQQFWTGALKGLAVGALVAASWLVSSSFGAEPGKSLDATRLTLDVKGASLAEVLAEIEKQTGNQLSDEREQFGQDAPPKMVMLKADDEPFWSALDRLLDDAKLTPYPASGVESLALVEREPTALRRSGRATYVGPFRIEAASVMAQRGVRAPEQSMLQVQLEIAWEPRLRPLALTQLAADVSAMCDDGLETPTLAEEVEFDQEISAGNHAAEVTIPLQLPARRAKSLQTLSGTLTALVPGKIVDLKFDKLADAKEATQEEGGVSVTVDRVVKNQEVWEVHMRISVESDVEALQTHRGWVFENVATLIDNEGATIENAGFETTMQTEDEAGLAYFYELPEGVEIGDCTWVYRTPVDIESIAVEYELEDVLLP